MKQDFFDLPERSLQMPLRLRKTFAIFTPGTSLRRRVAYSFAIARLVLAPVILLAVYYLFQMGWIAIVSLAWMPRRPPLRSRLQFKCWKPDAPNGTIPYFAIQRTSKRITICLLRSRIF